MKLVIDISKERYDEIMSMDWKNCRRFFDEEIRAIHDGKEPKTGNWYKKLHEICYTCDQCRTTNASGVKYNFCPHCGAKMEVQE